MFRNPTLKRRTAGSFGDLPPLHPIERRNSSREFFAREQGRETGELRTLSVNWRRHYLFAWAQFYAAIAGERHTRHVGYRGIPDRQVCSARGSVMKVCSSVDDHARANRRTGPEDHISHASNADFDLEGRRRSAAGTETPPRGGGWFIAGAAYEAQLREAREQWRSGNAGKRSKKCGNARGNANRKSPEKEPCFRACSCGVRPRI